MLGKIRFDQHVYIYGAGFAGLSLAYRLKQLNVPFTLYEKVKVGGKISTKMSDYGPMEAAASTLYINAEAEKFINELNLPYLEAQKKLKRWIWHKHGPASPFSLSLVFKLLFKLSTRFPEITERSSVEDIFLPLLGRKYVDELLSCILQGIHGTEAKNLHFLSLFPFAKGQKFPNYFIFIKKLKNEMKNGRSTNIKGSVSFAGGMQTLINRLHQEVEVFIKPLPQSFSLENNSVFCTSAKDAARLLSEACPDIAHALNQIDYCPMTSLTIMLKNELPELKNSFGMLIPQKFGGNILGIIHQSGIFPKNYSAHCYSMICKGVMKENDVVAELEKKISSFNPSDILQSSLSSWEEALPLYNEQRFEAIKSLEKLLTDRTGLSFFGNYTKGISLRSMIEQTRSIQSASQ